MPRLLTCICTRSRRTSSSMMNTLFFLLSMFSVSVSASMSAKSRTWLSPPSMMQKFSGRDWESNMPGGTSHAAPFASGWALAAEAVCSPSARARTTRLCPRGRVGSATSPPLGASGAAIPPVRPVRARSRLARATGRAASAPPRITHDAIVVVKSARVYWSSCEAPGRAQGAVTCVGGAGT